MQAVLPYAGLSLLLLMAVTLIGKDEPLLDVSVEEEKGGAGKTAGRMLRGAVPLLILPALVPTGGFSDTSISAGPDLCDISYSGDKQKTVLVGGLFLAFDIFMFLCIYRKYEADSGSQRISHFCRAGKGTSDGNPYEPDHQQCFLLRSFCRDLAVIFPLWSPGESGRSGHIDRLACKSDIIQILCKRVSG